MNRFPCRPDTGINRKAKHRLEDRLVSEEYQRIGESIEPGETVSLVVRRNGLAPKRLAGAAP